MRKVTKTIFGLVLLSCCSLGFAADEPKPQPPSDIPKLKSFDKKDIEDFCNKVCDNACNSVPDVAKADCRRDCPKDCIRDVTKEAEKQKMMGNKSGETKPDQKDMKNTNKP